MKLFKDLTEEEEKEFRNWARENYKPYSDICGFWHPVVQDECRKMNSETFLDFETVVKDFFKENNLDN